MLCRPVSIELKAYSNDLANRSRRAQSLRPDDLYRSLNQLYSRSESVRSHKLEEDIEFQLCAFATGELLVHGGQMRQVALPEEGIEEYNICATTLDKAVKELRQLKSRGETWLGWSSGLVLVPLVHAGITTFGYSFRVRPVT